MDKRIEIHLAMVCEVSIDFLGFSRKGSPEGIVNSGGLIVRIASYYITPPQEGEIRYVIT